MAMSREPAPPRTTRILIAALFGLFGAALGAFAIALAFALIHPWVDALVAPTVAIFALVLLLRERKAPLPALAGAVASGAVLVGALVLLPGTWDPFPAFLKHAGPRAWTLVTDPASIFPLPPYVDFGQMITWPLVAVALAGLVVALRRRTRLGLLAVAWVAVTLPFTLVDWFDVWFIPHRTVAYLTIGVALLAGVAVEASARALANRRRVLRLGAAGAACALAFALVLPTAVGVATWYRIYGPDDYDAFHALDAQHPAFVMAASWQARAGYRALTGADATYDPAFFTDSTHRAAVMKTHPGLVVLVDANARRANVPLDFLASWDTVGAWGADEAFTAAGG
ncbi:MAG: hypothetical protein ACYDCK_14735 [Thermoplasmatota archaeon]